jgi:predicted secreted protein
MFLFTYFLLFVLIWWIIFFVSLPIKINIPSHQEKGHASSAPKNTYVGFKFLLTTAITLVIMIFLLLIKFDLGIIFKT